MATVVSDWARLLGLLPVPLRADSKSQFVLLNGSQGNFCLDEEPVETGPVVRSTAWSADVGHYISLSPGTGLVRVLRWDAPEEQTFPYRQVSQDLALFHEQLEREQPRRDLSVVSRFVTIFHETWSAVGSASGLEALRTFLCLLASEHDDVAPSSLERSNWGINETAASEAVSGIEPEVWYRLRESLRRSDHGLRPDVGVVLRHASGRVFQEAHFAAVVEPQLHLFGSTKTIRVKPSDEATGIHFTPPAIARSVVEQALNAAAPLSEHITVLDPACGSGEFLKETLRQLRLGGYSGRVSVIGFDLSAAAVELARFVLAWERRSIAGMVVDTEVEQADSINKAWPRADLILMNPPFVSWEDMEGAQRELVRATLSDHAGSRPDLAMAFLAKAEQGLKSRGVVGCVVPASLLDSLSAKPLRQQMERRLEIRLLARLGSHTLFDKALVDTALLVGRKDPAPRNERTWVLWSDSRFESTARALRALRSLAGRPAADATPLPRVRGNAGFSVYERPVRSPLLGWGPRPHEAWKLLTDLDDARRAGQLFEIKQGVRTGKNDVFVLTKEFERIPHKERRYFRRAVVNKSIRDGRLVDVAWVFYPYDASGLSLESESELSEAVPFYYSTYLLPAREELRSRARVKMNWWSLSEHRAWQRVGEPKLVSAYFGGSGSFAWDAQGDFVVVQGFAWMPNPASGWGEQCALGYLAYLNSPVAARLISALSNNVGGGQWDLSTRFVANLPVPDPRSAALPDLAALGERIRTRGLSSVELSSLDEVAMRALRSAPNA